MPPIIKKKKSGKTVQIILEKKLHEVFSRATRGVLEFSSPSITLQKLFQQVAGKKILVSYSVQEDLVRMVNYPPKQKDRALFLVGTGNK